ncbi:MAG: tetratricopeptide repeat protein [bacterium]|nr:tetratricopeptide repeat protein [bacterium]
MPYTRIRHWILVPILLCGLGWSLDQDSKQASPASEVTNSATFVGRGTCKKCHEKEFTLWLGSDHDNAMETATAESILGNFEDAVFERHGVKSRFYKRDGRFYLLTEGVGGKQQEFEVKYTFGVRPLQQYLVAFPGGRLQCLPIAWDTEGNSWFHLQGDTHVPADDWLHWTQPAQNWNGMCASCHSTDLNKGLNPKTLEFDTQWAEIDVGCEACHGPASDHVAWAGFNEETRALSPSMGFQLPTSGLEPRGKVELCARCHSRRTELKDFAHDGGDMLDSFLPDLLIEGHYYPDGQILDEVYVYGSFVQSPMYYEGVHCGNCHDVHSGALVAQGNALCHQCHDAKYSLGQHHHHVIESMTRTTLASGTVDIPTGAGTQCVSCHMAGRTYMVKDYRPDHSMRVPRPDLSISIGTPNACNQCHQDQEAQWAADKVVEWFGVQRPEHFGAIIEAGRRGEAGGDLRLQGLIRDARQPAIVRATALTLLGNYGSDSAWLSLKEGLHDAEALVRHAAVRTYREPNLEARLANVVPLLLDPVRAVRGEAAVNLSEIPGQYLPPDSKGPMKRALAQYRQTMDFNADMPSSGLALGNLLMNLGRGEEAVQQFEKALAIDNRFIPARANLAVLFSMLGQNAKAEACLRKGLKLQPEAHNLAYSLALLLAEKGEFDKAIALMDSAAGGLPNSQRAHYNLGLLLQQQGLVERAEVVLLRAVQIDPKAWDPLFALADHYLKRGNAASARKYAEKMLELRPGDATARAILRRTQR